MKLFICEKPSQAEDIAKVLGSARKTETHWETAGGRVTWCYGHMLELVEPEDYDDKYSGSWSFATLPITPSEFRWVPNRPKDWMDSGSKSFVRKGNAQLKAIGSMLKECSQVIIATDPDRQGEMIGRNVLTHFNYRNEGSVYRLWLSSKDETSVRRSLAQLKPASATTHLYRVAQALAEADWLVGMNCTRGLTTKTAGKGVVSVGRVQTPTLALIVRRDRAIGEFKARDYYELAAQIQANSGGSVTLRYSPSDDDKIIWERSKAETIATGAKGISVKLAFEESKKFRAPPKLFTLAALQKAANKRWDWTAKKTLEVAQSLYEKHKAASYPRTNCEFLPTEQIEDVDTITKQLVQLKEFSHLSGHAFNARKSVFDSSKVEAHHAIIPTTIEPPLDRMDSDERKLWLLIAKHYIAALLPDYEYLASKISTKIDGREFAITGTVPVAPGWKLAAGDDDEEEDGGKLPRLVNGESGHVTGCTVDPKKTKAPAYYTEAALIDDMENIAKYVTDPAQKALLKSTDGKVGSADKGIGTSATRGDIIETLKNRKVIELKGKQLRATTKGVELITYLERELPSLVDPGETAVWEEKLGLIAEGTLPLANFRQDMAALMRSYISILSNRADAAPETEVAGIKLSDQGEYFTASTVKGRLYKGFFGHQITAGEMAALLKGEILTVEDCVSKAGVRLGPKRIRFNAKKEPWPGVEFADAAPAKPSLLAAGSSSSSSKPRKSLF